MTDHASSDGYFEHCYSHLVITHYFSGNVPTVTYYCHVYRGDSYSNNVLLKSDYCLFGGKNHVCHRFHIKLLDLYYIRCVCITLLMIAGCYNLLRNYIKITIFVDGLYTVIWNVI